MMIKTRRTIISMLAAVALLSSVAYASPDKDSGEKKGAKHEHFYKELNLTDDQKKALEENKNKNREQMKALFEGMREKRTLIRQELQKDQLDMEKINQTQNELKALQSQMLDNRLTGILEVRKILTPEQFKKFSTKMGDRWEDRKEERKEHSQHKKWKTEEDSR